MVATTPSRATAASGSRAWLPALAGQLLFGLISVWLFAAILLWPSLGSFGPGVSAALAYALYAVHVVLVGRRASAVDPVLWIPVSMLFFYFGLPVSMEVLGFSGSYDAFGIGGPLNLDRGFAMALLTLTSFLAGMHLAGFRDLSAGPDMGLRRDASLTVPAWLLTLGALGMIAIGVAIVGPSVVFGTYDVWWGAKTAGADARFVDIGLVFAMAGVFALLASHDRRQPAHKIAAYAVALALAVMYIQKGARGSLISFGVGAGWCYSQRVRRVHFVPVLAVATIALLMLPVLRVFRTTKQIGPAAEASISELAGTSVYEMGGSVMIFGYVLDLVPSRQDYIYGMSFVRAFVDAVPNLGLTPGKSFSIGTLEHSPSSWITAQLSPAWWASGGGYGFTMGAEFYYNFGLPGVLIGLLFMGWLTVRIRNSSQGSALRLVASALFFAGMAVYVRNWIGSPLRTMLWPVVALFLLRWLTQLLGRRFGRARGITAPAASPET